MLFIFSDNLSPDRTSLIEITIYVNTYKLGAAWVKSEFQMKYNDEDVIERMANVSLLTYAQNP